MLDKQLPFHLFAEAGLAEIQYGRFITRFQR